MGGSFLSRHFSLRAKIFCVHFLNILFALALVYLLCYTYLTIHMQIDHDILLKIFVTLFLFSMLITGIWMWWLSLIQETNLMAEDKLDRHIHELESEVKKRETVSNILEETSNQQRLILENASIGIAYVKRELLVWSNSRFMWLCGEVQKGPGEKLPLAPFLRQAGIPSSIMAEAQDVLAAGRRFSIELLLNISPLRRHWCVLTITAINPAMMRRGSIWLLSDISERKLAEEKLCRSEERLKELNENLEAQVRSRTEELQRSFETIRQADKMASLGILVSGVAHEINNPASFIRMNIGLLEEIWRDLLPLMEKENKETDTWIAGMPFAFARTSIPKLLQGIHQGAERVSTIVRNLKDYARQSPLNMDGSVIINDALTSSLELLSTALNKATSRLEVDRGEDLPPFRGDLSRIEQVLINLVQNAYQALTHRSQSIRIQTYQSDGSVCFEITDQGRGIAAEHLTHVRDPFFHHQARSGRNRPGPLGLRQHHRGTRGNHGNHVRTRPGHPHPTHVSGTPRPSLIPPLPKGAPMNMHAFPRLPILVVDDERAALDGFEIALVSSGYTKVVTMDDSRKVLPFLMEQDVELIILDLLMPHISGSELIEHIRHIRPATPILVVTAVNDIDSVVECIRNGAQDYILKPVDKDQLRNRVRKALEMSELERENALLRESLLENTLLHPEAFHEIVTADPKMCTIFKYCEAVAPSSRPILITGETGTGKELIARVIHRLCGRKGEFVAVNIAAFDDPLFADTLFGHVRGAFTGADTPRQGLVEKADGGTLFLDEIGDLPPASQVKLLRLLQEQEYFPVGSDNVKKANVRIVTSTLKDLAQLRRGGHFRDDLYYRLITHRIHIPPLRERASDIPLLLDHYLDQESREFGRRRPTYHPTLISLLKSYAFPGNVRELRAMVGDALMNHTARMLSSSSFRKYIFNEDEECGAVETVKLQDPLDELEFSADNMPQLKAATRKLTLLLIRQAMQLSGGNQTVAARILGVSQQALSARLKKCTVEEEEEKI